MGKLQSTLAELRRFIVATALRGAGATEALRGEHAASDAVGRVDALDTDTSGRDLNTHDDDVLEIPKWPVAWMNLKRLDGVIRRPDRVPAGVDAKPLGVSEWSYLATEMTLAL